MVYEAVQMVYEAVQMVYEAVKVPHLGRDASILLPSFQKLSAFFSK